VLDSIVSTVTALARRALVALRTHPCLAPIAIVALLLVW
jgi:hypothetical protein